MSEEIPVIRQGASAYLKSLREFGAPTRVVDRTVAVAPTVSRIMTNNPRRVAWLIVNASANTAYIGFSSNVTPAAAIVVGAGGGSIASRVDEDGEMTAWELWGITSAGAATLYIVEVETL